MSGLYDFISSKLSKLSTTQTQKDVDRKFTLFSELPPELRLKIWKHALPERVVEASLRYENQTWMCSYSPPKNEIKITNSRQLPTLSRVNSECREFCKREYVLFANTYIHPTLDFLYISWYWGQINTASSHSQTKFFPIEGKPFNKFHTIAMTIGRNPTFDTRFGALVDCLNTLGTPEELLLSLVGPKLPSVHSVSTGFSISNGNSVALLDWPNTTESQMAHEVRAHVMTAIEAEQTDSSTFKMPKISQRLYYIYSGP